jgi:hypothetical protein
MRRTRKPMAAGDLHVINDSCSFEHCPLFMTCESRFSPAVLVKP